MRLRMAVVFLACVTGCSSGSGAGYYYGPGDSDGSVPTNVDSGGGGGGGNHDGGGGGAVDLSTSEPPDFATQPDLSTPPDFSTARADLSVPCVPGHYVGPLTASVTFGGVPATITGMAMLDVGAPQAGMLPVTGTMSGSGFGGQATAHADVQGSLDCNALHFDGQLQNGMGTAFGTTLPFTGTCSADYDPNQPAFVNGTLTTMGITGSGTWSAAKQ